MSLRNSIWFYGFALGTVLVDQVTKFAAREVLAHRSITVIPGLFDLSLTFNSGAAFGTLPNWAPMFIIIGLVAIWAIVKLRGAAAGSRVLAVGLGLLLGGAIGNLIDRISAPNRGVTDFLSLHITMFKGTYTWPTFNIADIAIVAGALLVFFHVYIVEKRKQEEAAEQEKHDENSEQQTQD